MNRVHETTGPHVFCFFPVVVQSVTRIFEYSLNTLHFQFVYWRYPLPISVSLSYDVMQFFLKTTNIFWGGVLEKTSTVLNLTPLCPSVHSSVEKLCQTSYGPDNYTLSWDVKDKSSITMFRVYNEGVLQGTTLNTNYTVGGLQPCQPYQAKVEALCGDGVVINVKTATAHTGKV